MKVKDLIGVLNEINPENEILVCVKDYYTVYGQDAHILTDGLITNKDTMTTRLMCGLDEIIDPVTRKTKKPKITFRID